MGYDLHGINPLGYDKGKYPTLTKWEDADWDEREEMTEDEKTKYWDEMGKRDSETGCYFRANVWWWRRIWIFTCKVCEDVMTPQDMEAGDSNSGIEIDHETCMKMVPLMQVAVEDGSAMDYQKTVTEYIETAPKKENGMYEEEHWMANYPFDVKYFQEFIHFVERSGGFEIS
jgi:hypothetical protein